MAAFKIHKVVSSLPSSLAANCLYLVRTGVGFDLYASDSTGSIAHPLNVGSGATGGISDLLTIPHAELLPFEYMIVIQNGELRRLTPSEFITIYGLSSVNPILGNAIYFKHNAIQDLSGDGYLSYNTDDTIYSDEYVEDDFVSHLFIPKPANWYDIAPENAVYANMTATDPIQDWMQDGFISFDVNEAWYSDGLAFDLGYCSHLSL